MPSVDGDDTLLFDESAQKIFRLNPMACVIWSGLERGEDLDTIKIGLTGQGCTLVEAETYVASAVIQWLSLGWLKPGALAEALGGQATSLVIKITDVRLRVRVFANAFPHCLRDLFGHMTLQDGPGPVELQLVQMDHWWAILEGSTLRGVYPDVDLAPALKATVTDMFCRALPNGFVVHGALSEIDGGRILFLGAPGAGKSTLVTILSQAGFLCLADDIVRVYDDGCAEGVPFAPGLKSGSWDLFADPAALEKSAWRRADGQRVCYLADSVTHTSGPSGLDHIILLSRVPGAMVAINAIEQEQALRRLLESSFSPEGRITASALVALMQQMARSRFHEITYGEARDLVGPLVALARSCRSEKSE